MWGGGVGGGQAEYGVGVGGEVVGLEINSVPTVRPANRQPGARTDQ